MASKTRLMQTNFSGGELSPHVEGRPDLAKYFNGALEIENFWLFPEGGAFFRTGTRWITSTKNNGAAILIGFEFNAEETYMLEFGDQYIRFFKNKAAILSGAVPYEISSPYAVSDLSNLQYRQSADQLFIVHPDFLPRKLSRVNDTNWSINAMSFDPPPSFEADEDLNTGLTPGATSGTGINFVADSAVFLDGDVGRQIVFGASRAVITALVGGPAPVTTVTADIIDPFPNTNTIPASGWFLRGSPQATLDPNKKEPVGDQITLVAGAPAFRSSIVGKFIKLLGGLIKVTVFDSNTQVKGQILSILQDATQADPPAQPKGSWRLEVGSWSTARGFPRAIEFYQGRLFFGGTKAQPTTWWASQSDSFENFAVGSLADDALQYSIANRKVNVIRWLVALKRLFVGDAQNEHVIIGPNDEPLGGDVVPSVDVQSAKGSTAIQPVIVDSAIVSVNRNRRRVYATAYSFEQDSYLPEDATILARHITTGGFKQHALDYAQEPNSMIPFVRSDGVMPALTLMRPQQVSGWTRTVTDGQIESYAVIPGKGESDEIWVIVKRIINGQEKRFIEVFETESTLQASVRPWAEFHTDAAIEGQYTGVPDVTTLSGFDHLEGKAVDVIVNGSYRESVTVTGGQITVQTPIRTNDIYEVGLHYNGHIKSMRPAIPGAIVEGLARRWNTLGLRLLDSLGGRVNGEDILYPPASLGTQQLFSGNRKVKPLGWDEDGYVTVEQTQPYPFKLLSLFGEIEFGDSM